MIHAVFDKTHGCRRLYLTAAAAADGQQAVIRTKSRRVSICFVALIPRDGDVATVCAVIPRYELRTVPKYTKIHCTTVQTLCSYPELY